MQTYAVVFPGQGSQSPGMLNDWGDHPIVRTAIEEVSDALGQDMGALIREGSKEDLALTTNTQPAMLLAGVAAWRMWQAESDSQPAVLAGHSLGEYSALVASGVLTLSQAAPLVRFRAMAMQEAVPVGTGAMAAILGLPSETVQTVCAQYMQSNDEIAEAANFNDPNQTVIAGSKAGVEQACELLKAAGAKRALLLPVSAPFHSSLMLPAAERLKEKLAHTEFAKPNIPVINNVDVKIEDDADAIRDALFRQAYGAVRWVEVVRAIQQQGVQHLLECGPGKVLTNLNKRIDAGITSAAVFNPSSLSEAQSALIST